jgi:hypothetical protein
MRGLRRAVLPRDQVEGVEENASSLHSVNALPSAELPQPRGRPVSTQNPESQTLSVKPRSTDANN